MEVSIKNTIKCLTLLELPDNQPITKEIVRSQYRKLCLVYHPDQSAERHKDGEKFIEIKNAEEYLSNNINVVNEQIRSDFSQTGQYSAYSETNNAYTNKNKTEYRDTQNNSTEGMGHSETKNEQPRHDNNGADYGASAPREPKSNGAGKWITFSIIAVFAIIGLLTAVKNRAGGVNVTQTPMSGTAASNTYTMGTGGTSGTFYGYGCCVAIAVSDNTDLTIKPVSSGGEVNNIYQVENGTFDLGISAVSSLAYSYLGVTYTDTPMNNLRALCSLYPECIVPFTKDKSINSFADLKGKTVYAGAPGMPLFYYFTEILAACDLTLDDVVLYEKDQNEDVFALLAEDKVDAEFAYTNMTTELCAFALQNHFRLISFDEDFYYALTDRCPWYFEAPTYTGGYEDENRKAHYLVVDNVLFCREDLPEQTAYEIVKSIYEKSDLLLSYHGEGYYAKDPEFLSRVAYSFPIHEGAYKYFAEIGCFS